MRSFWKRLIGLLIIPLSGCGTMTPEPDEDGLSLKHGFIVERAAQNLQNPKAVWFENNLPIVMDDLGLLEIGPNGPKRLVEGKFRAATQDHMGLTILADEAGKLWLRSAKGEMRPLNAKLPHQNITALLSGRDGSILVALAAKPNCKRKSCAGQILQLNMANGKSEIHASGFANPSAMAYSPKGKLLVADERGNSDNAVFYVTRGVWYGWPPNTNFDNPKPMPLWQGPVVINALATNQDRRFGGMDTGFLATNHGKVFTAHDNGINPFLTGLGNPTALAFNDGLWVADSQTGTLYRITPRSTQTAAKDN